MIILIAVLQAVVIVCALVMIFSAVQIRREYHEGMAEIRKEMAALEHRVDWLEGKFTDMEDENDTT